MALNVGQDFKQRWLDAPEAVRQAFIDDLHRICDVLHPESDIQKWVAYDQQQQHRSEQKIEQAYAERKAQLIEEARIRRQQELERSLQEKRDEQAAYARQLQQDEQRQFNEQAQTLALIRRSLDNEIQTYTARYHKNPANGTVSFDKTRLAISDHEILSELESVKLRLELEAESLIEQAVTVFRARLHSAAQEEIAFILKNSSLSEDKKQS
ncbi:hypothetical protein CDG60_01975 [Acinetobacter chinensis]|uniref:Uncharacterized protein n=1 Tax=Acinetobacter chinensis TaxID=2004650 RepID=A0A3B7LU56_9GAMM|nr:hypothetical protein [Acinetobacter chinensis]AXY55475.1 hypothetical protein CDG60_01975 [Acinetobacter chinensis]